MNLRKKNSGQLNKSNCSHVPAVTSREGMVRKGNDVGLLPKYKFGDIVSCKSRFSITFVAENGFLMIIQKQIPVWFRQKRGVLS